MRLFSLADTNIQSLGSCRNRSDFCLFERKDGTVVYGAADSRAGVVESQFTLLGDLRLNHKSELVAGAMGPKCGNILTEFFREKRQQQKKL